MVAVVPAAEDVALPDSLREVETAGAALPRSSWSKRVRLIELRKAIEGGEYHVPATALAGALQRSARSAN